MSEKHLYLVDGHALAYRGYFAMLRNPLSNSAGQPTGAVFAFAGYLLRLIKQFHCPYFAVVFDSGKPSFRREIYEEYKANRTPMPDDLKSQMPLIFRLVECLNIPLIMKDGYEADDIIAHLTQSAERQGFEVSIVTKDKDLMQLVSKKVTMLAPETGGILEPMGPADVKEKLGVPPEKILDLLALMGDASDNIPGVAGVGPKTALKILEEAGSVELLIKNPSCLSNAKLAEKIRANVDNILLSKKLATLCFDVPIELGVADLAARPVKKLESLAFFKEQSFSSLLRDPLFDTNEKTEFKVTVPRTLDEVAALVKTVERAKMLCVDTETTSTEPRSATLVGISMAVNDSEAWYLPVGHDDHEDNLPVKKTLELLKGVLESAHIKKTGQNLKYDYQVFKGHGVTLRGIAFDTMVAAYCIDPGNRPFNLDAMASRFLSLKTIPIEALIGKGKDQKSFATVAIDKAAEYSGEDVVIPLRLQALFEPMLTERGLKTLFDSIEMPLVTVLAELEWQGISVDTEFLRTLSFEYTARLNDISREVYALAGEEFNLNSPKQIAEILFTKLNLTKSKKTKTGLSTDVDALEKLAAEHPIAQRILDHRETQKLLSTYIDALPGQVNQTSGRVHTSFNQTVAATGRLSSTDPNLQNIPIRTDAGRRIREAFVAPRGHVLVSADYSQVELRILAHLSQDPLLIKAFEEGQDIHTSTASAMHGVFIEMVTPEMRRAAKTINFGLMYGMGPINLSRQLGITFKEAQTFIEKYFQQFPTIRRYMDSSIDKARTLGYSETMLGRKRYLSDINAENRQVREAAERTAINTPVQGTAADIIKIAMVNIHAAMAEVFPHAAMLLQVHDELVFETPEKDAEKFSKWVQKNMSEAYKLCVPLKVDVGIGKNWAEAH